MELYRNNGEPPSSNRGLNLQDGQERVNKGVDFFGSLGLDSKKMDLRLGLDYLTWTHTFSFFTDYQALLDEMSALFGDRINWDESREKKIGQWYQCCHYSILGVTTAYNVLDNGDIQCIIQVGGSIINSIPLREWLRFLAFRLYPIGGFCPRVDLFADDDTGLISKVRSKIIELCAAIDSGSLSKDLVSGFSANQEVRSGSLGGVQCKTLYLGSRQSDKFSRIYDKIKEKKEREEKREVKTELKSEVKTEVNCIKENDKKEVKENANREKRREEYRQKRREEKARKRRAQGIYAATCNNGECRNGQSEGETKQVEVYTRWEKELKSEASNSVFRLLCEWYRSNCKDENIIETLQSVIRDLIFSGYQFFAERLNASLQRKNIIADWWREFLHLIAHVQFRLPTVRSVKTIEKTYTFLRKQVATSIAVISKILGARFPDFMEELRVNGSERMSSQQAKLIDHYFAFQ